MRDDVRAGKPTLRAGTVFRRSRYGDIAMSTNSIDRRSAGCAIAALAALIPFAVHAGTSADQDKSAPQVVADASTSNGHARQAALPVNAFPGHERGVRQAAAESNEALRRYIWRTRMI